MIYESSSTTACYTPDRHTGKLTDYELIHMPYWEIIEYRKEYAVDDYIAHFFEAGMDYSSEHLSEIKSYFPTAYKVYQQMLKDALRR